MYYMHHYVIRWDKVQTVDDLKRLIAAMQITFEPHHPNVKSIEDLVQLEAKQPAHILYCADRKPIDD